MWAGSSPTIPVSYDTQHADVKNWFVGEAGVVMNAATHANRKGGARQMDEAG